MNNKLFIILLFILLNPVFPQVINKTDTLSLSPGQNTFQLKTFPIIRSSTLVINNGRMIDSVKINEISGEVIINEEIETDHPLIISYQVLDKDIPKIVGPLTRQFPILESLETYSEKQEFKLNETYDDQEMVSTGNVFRNVQVNPLGGVNFTGGMQISLQGNLSKDIQVSGVLTDQQTGIQPEGNTRELDDFDRVYLHVEHPNFNATAGDIDLQIRKGENFEIDRKLIGLKQELNYGKYEVKTVFGGSNGIYNEVYLTGIDGNQGPYQLRSKSESSDIIVLSGSEKVYLDGVQLTRGENFDYTIDYSLAEIVFTPKNMIQFDSDILVEYQYSDFQYSRNTIGGLFTRSLAKDSDISIGWFREYDQFDERENQFSDEILDSLQNAGDGSTYVTTSELDSTGDYVLQDGIFVYTQNKNNPDPRYSVSFQNDPANGSYIRKVSQRGQLYYEFVNEASRTRNQDLYSPSRRLQAPENKDIFYTGTNLEISKSLNAGAELSISVYDKNTVSNISDDDNLGTEYSLYFLGEKSVFKDKINTRYKVDYLNRSSQFSSLNRARSVNFFQDWDINNFQIGDESKFSSNMTIDINNLGIISSSFSNYKFGNDSRNRFQNNINISKGHLHKLVIQSNEVHGHDHTFSQFHSYAAFLKGLVHPFVEYENELSTNIHYFYWIKGGIKGEWKTLNTSLGVGKRIDKISPVDLDLKMIDASESFFGALEISGRTKSLFHELELRKRIKDDLISDTKLDYELLRLKMNYYNPDNPFKLDLYSKLEESLTETRAVVFDSIGEGFGQYRYDPIFNEYVEDPNGPYRSFTVFSGDRKPTTIFTNTFRSRIDLSRSSVNKLKNFMLDGSIRTEYRGKDFIPGQILEYDISDELLKAFVNYNIESSYRKPGKGRRIRLGYKFRNDLNGMDPRGNSENHRSEFYSELQEPVSNSYLLLSNLEIHEGHKKSLVISTRDREYSGWSGQFGLKLTGLDSWKFEGKIEGGSDSGKSTNIPFNAQFYGIGTDLTHFIGKKGRVEFAGEWINASGNLKYYDLPPEVINSYLIGENINLSARVHYLAGKYLSINAGITFTDNARYDRLITMSGEVRAYF